MELLTGEPNLVKHYKPHRLPELFCTSPHAGEMDKLRFDCFRVGVAKENIEEMEPVLRNTHLASFDINAIK